MLTHPKGRVGGRRPVDQLVEILDPVPDAADQVLPALSLRTLQYQRVGLREVRWREEIQHLPGREVDNPLMLRIDAWQITCGCVPPVLTGEEVLGNDIEGVIAPCGIFETLVAAVGSSVARARPCLQCLLPGKAPKFGLLRRGACQMHRPVQIGRGKRGR